jgi:hypothetical protein
MFLPLACSPFVLTFRIGLVGLAWSWVIPQAGDRQPDARSMLRFVQLMAAALLLGLLATLLIDWLRFELGMGHVFLGLAASGALGVGGLVAGLVLRRMALRDLLAPGFLLTVLLLAGVWLVFMFPGQSEWLLGGWDPGVYLNQGICVARTGTFHPGPGSGYALLRPDEFAPFTRSAGPYLECFPGVPINPDTGEIVHYFFRMTPTWFASVAQSGGVAAAVRASLLMGCFGALVFVGALLSIAPKRPSLAVFSSLILFSHPLWLYHLHLPVSEVLQLLLVCGVGMLFPFRSVGRATPLVLAATVLAAVLNRMSFLPFAGMLMLGLAILDFARPDRPRVLYERVALLTAILLGGGFDLLGTAVTIIRLAGTVPKLVGVAAACVMTALLLDAVAVLCPRLREAGLLRNAWLQRFGVLAVLVGLSLVWHVGRDGYMGGLAANMRSVMPYIGPWLAGVAIVGALHLFWTSDFSQTGVRAVILFLLSVSFVIAAGGFIARLYPWATRRYLVYAVPMLAILAGHLVSVLWQRRSCRGIWKAAALCVLIAVPAANAKRSWHAWNRTEYVGLSDALRQVADQLGEQDVVVCDHPWWATPLALMYGKTVLNAKEFYDAKSPDTMAEGMKALARLKSEGRRVRFLTTTRTAALDVYPLPVGPVTLDWQSEERGFWEFIHHKRADDFEMRERRHVFRLYTWGGADARQP